MTPWLSASEVVQLTGYKQRSKQCAALKSMGVPFITKQGLLKVYRAYFLRGPGHEKERADIARMERDDLQNHVLPLDQMRGLPNAIGYAGAGVYFLWDGPRLLYIGHSAQIKTRVDGHLKRRDGVWESRAAPFMPFTRATVWPRRKGILRELESAFIQKYWPQFNEQA